MAPLPILFERTGIKAPGRMNIFLGGRFQTIELDRLNQEQMKELYDNKCRFVKLTTLGRKKYYPDEKEIKIDKIPPTSK